MNGSVHLTARRQSYGQSPEQLSLVSFDWENSSQNQRDLLILLQILHGAMWQWTPTTALGWCLKKSKCNQFGVGSDILVGVTSSDLCPITAILSYIDVRGNQLDAFFLNSPHRPITKHWFVGEIHCIFGSLQHEYAGHNFRTGAATAAAMAGIEDSIIQIHSRWHSAAFLQVHPHSQGTPYLLNSHFGKRAPRNINVTWRHVKWPIIAFQQNNSVYS